MKRWAWFIALTVLIAAQTKDISGIWVGKMNGPMGEVEVVYELKVAGGKITGTQRLPFGDSPIVDGKIDGNNLELTIEMESFGNLQRRTAAGSVEGDELRITPAMPVRPAGAGGPGGPGGPPRQFQSGPVAFRRGTPTPSYRAPSVDYKSLPKVELPAVRPLAPNGLALTPPMGWNSWNKFRTRIDDKTIRGIADALVSSGMRDAGYIHLNIDDGWEWKRGDDGVLQPNPNFPDMKALADYVHSKGLKLGIYSSPGPRTCGGFEGSYGHEELDARTWAAWGIDYLKYDWCSAARIWKDEYMRAAYQKMGEAIRKAGRPMVYSLCQYGRAQVGEWGPLVDGNLWRTTGDIRDQWASMARIGFAQSEGAAFVKPGNWNDPDMLEVGNGGMSTEEYRTHFSLWAMLAAPLIAGNDVRNMTADIRTLLLNKEVIAVDQDRLGQAGRRLSMDGDTEIWVKPLDRGDTAVALFNRGDAMHKVSVKWTELGVTGTPKVRDLWAHSERAGAADGFAADVAPHGVVMLRVSPAH